MQALGLTPSLLTYNSLIAACASVGEYGSAVELFDSMTKVGVKPDTDRSSILFRLQDRCDAWTRSVAMVSCAR